MIIELRNLGDGFREGTEIQIVPTRDRRMISPDTLNGAMQFHDPDVRAVYIDGALAGHLVEVERGHGHGPVYQAFRDNKGMTILDDDIINAALHLCRNAEVDVRLRQTEEQAG